MEVYLLHVGPREILLEILAKTSYSYGPICNQHLSTLNESIFVKTDGNTHMGSTNHYGKVCVMGSGVSARASPAYRQVVGRGY